MAEDLSVCKEIFNKFDVDGNGCITAKELVQAMRAMGLKVTEEVAQKKIAVYDANNDGYLEFDEFVKLMNLRSQVATSDPIKRYFKKIDKDGNGKLTLRELKQALQQDPDMQMTDEEIEEMMYEADTNGDGLIDYEEFCAVMKPDSSQAKSN